MAKKGVNRRQFFGQTAASAAAAADGAAESSGGDIDPKVMEELEQRRIFELLDTLRSQYSLLSDISSNPGHGILWFGGSNHVDNSKDLCRLVKGTFAELQESIASYRKEYNRDPINVDHLSKRNLYSILLERKDPDDFDRGVANVCDELKLRLHEKTKIEVAALRDQLIAERDRLAKHLVEQHGIETRNAEYKAKSWLMDKMEKIDISWSFGNLKANYVLPAIKVSQESGIQAMDDMMMAHQNAELFRKKQHDQQWENIKDRLNEQPEKQKGAFQLDDKKHHGFFKLSYDKHTAELYLSRIQSLFVDYGIRELELTAQKVKPPHNIDPSPFSPNPPDTVYGIELSQRELGVLLKRMPQFESFLNQAPISGFIGSQNARRRG